MICHVDLEHPKRGPSMVSEGSEATQCKADRVPAGTEHHPDGPTILADFFRLAGSVTPRPEAGAAPARA